MLTTRIFTIAIYTSLMILGLKVSESDEEKIRQVIRSANDAEMQWYRNPTDDAGKRELLKWVTYDSMFTNVSNLIARARQNGSVLKPESTHSIDEFVSVEIRGDTAVAKTLETSRLFWSSGKEWPQTRNPHTYRLKKVGEEWKVLSDDYKY